MNTGLAWNDWVVLVATVTSAIGIISTAIWKFFTSPKKKIRVSGGQLEGDHYDFTISPVGSDTLTHLTCRVHHGTGTEHHDLKPLVRPRVSAFDGRNPVYYASDQFLANIFFEPDRPGKSSKVEISWVITARRKPRRIHYLFDLDRMSYQIWRPSRVFLGIKRPGNWGKPRDTEPDEFPQLLEEPPASG